MFKVAKFRLAGKKIDCFSVKYNLADNIEKF